MLIWFWTNHIFVLYNDATTETRKLQQCMQAVLMGKNRRIELEKIRNHHARRTTTQFLCQHLEEEYTPNSFSLFNDWPCLRFPTVGVTTYREDSGNIHPNIHQRSYVPHSIQERVSSVSFSDRSMTPLLLSVCLFPYDPLGTNEWISQHFFRLR